MALTRKPAIDDARIGDRKAQIAIQNVRQRIEQIEVLLLAIEKQANQSSFDVGRLSSLAGLQQIVNEIRNLLNLLFAGDDGLVVLSGDSLITRQLEAGEGISIDNEDGVDGNPVISATSECCYPFLTTELDDDILTEDNHRIRVE